MHIPELFNDGFYVHIIASLYRVIIGLLISFVVGTLIGLIMGYSKKINKLLNPLIYFTYPIPKTALLPVVMTIYGLGDGSKIIIIVLITVFQVIVSVRDAVVNNIRLSVGTAFSVLFFAEAYGTKFGLGYFIQDAWTRINYIDMYSGIVVLSLLGLLIFLLIDFVESSLCKWKA